MYKKEDLDKFKEDGTKLLCKSGKFVTIIKIENYPMLYLRYLTGIKGHIHCSRIITDRDPTNRTYWDMSKIDGFDDVVETLKMTGKLFKCSHKNCYYQTTSNVRFVKHLNNTHDEKHEIPIKVKVEISREKRWVQYGNLNRTCKKCGKTFVYLSSYEKHEDNCQEVIKQTIENTGKTLKIRDDGFEIVKNA